MINMSKEYIERGATTNAVVEYYWKNLHISSHGLAKSINDVPTADVVEVKHGRWEKHKTMHGFVYCSACKDVYLDAEWLADGKWGYCPNCGAKMRGDGE